MKPLWTEPNEMRYSFGMSNLAQLPTPRTTGANQTVARNIKAEIGLADISQSVLAAALGQSEMWLSRRLSSKPAFSTDEVQAIADYFGIEVGELFVKHERSPRPVGPTGIEPMTSTVEYERLADVLPFRKAA